MHFSKGFFMWTSERKKGKKKKTHTHTHRNKNDDGAYLVSFLALTQCQIVANGYVVFYALF